MLIPFEEIVKDYDPCIEGLIHVGAHLGEEVDSYARSGVKNVIWIEGDADLTAKLRAKVLCYPGQKVITAIVGDVEGQEIEFHIATNRQSSSLLDLAKHKKYHPDIEIEEVRKVTTRRIDSLISSEEVSDGKYTFVNLDLQGGELMALNGMGEILDGMKWVYIEVNLTDIYHNCPLLSDIDSYLLNRGFVRRKTRITKYMWGDALYKRQKPRLLDRVSMKTSVVLYRLFMWQAVAVEIIKKKKKDWLGRAKRWLILS